VQQDPLTIGIANWVCEFFVGNKHSTQIKLQQLYAFGAGTNLFYHRQVYCGYRNVKIR